MITDKVLSMPELTSVSSGRLDDPASHIYAPDTGTAAQFDILKYSSSVDETRSGAKLSSFNGHNYERLIDKIVKRADSGDRFFSLEFFPARTFDGAMNLISTYVSTFSFSYTQLYMFLISM